MYVTYPVLLNNVSGPEIGRSGFRLDSDRENLKIGPPACLRPAGGPILRLPWVESGRNPARKNDFRPGNTIA